MRVSLEKAEAELAAERNRADENESKWQSVAASCMVAEKQLAAERDLVERLKKALAEWIPPHKCGLLHTDS